VSDRPLVSTAMPTYDRLQFLPAAVESIFAQTFRNWELIVADDGSGEPVLEYLRALERRERVRVLRREHSGHPGKARNAAIAEARGNLVAFLDSDDLWAPTKLEKQLAEMRARPACRWSYTGFVIVDADDVPLPSEVNRLWTAYSGEIFNEVVRGTASIRTPAVVANTELLRDVGAFDEAMDCAEDYDLWARLALRSPVCVVDEPLVRVRRHRRGDEGTIGGPHSARDYSLGKLARAQDGSRRALLEEERGRNAFLHAAVIAAHGGRWRALAIVARSLRFSWRYPRWWYGAPKALARVWLGARLPAARPPEPANARLPDSVETRVKGSDKELRAGDR
jgi:glycosyltransferase involved in cell wall biosynthesis